MKTVDIVKTSQTNLLRSKLRTFLTVAAVFIGAFTLSLTNGAGSGIRAYVNQELGNVGAEDTLIVQAKQSQNPISNDVKEYNPEQQKSGSFNTNFINKAGLEKISSTEGILETTPLYTVLIEYVSTGDKKFEATASQYVPGLNLQMAAGHTVDPNSTDSVTIPARYLKPGTEQEAIGKYITIAFKDSKGKLIERPMKIVGVQQKSLIGNQDMNISAALAKEINAIQTNGNASLADAYFGVFARFDKSYSKEQIQDLKDRLDKQGFTARTIQDQIGTVAQIIDAVIIVLNIFGLISLLAAAFGIINTLLMSVNERTSEIGLMKALGASRKNIFAIFSIEAVSIGFWGGLLGIIAAIGVGSVLSNLASKSFLKDFAGFQLLAFPIPLLLSVLIGIMLLAFLAGALPSVKASRLNPIEALRYE